MKLTDRQIQDLLRAARETHADEIDCEQFLHVMAAYAEACIAGGPLPPALEQAAAHERLCANCSEECRALVEALGESKGG